MRLSHTIEANFSQLAASETVKRLLLFPRSSIWALNCGCHARSLDRRLICSLTLTRRSFFFSHGIYGFLIECFRHKNPINLALNCFQLCGLRKHHWHFIMFQSKCHLMHSSSCPTFVYSFRAKNLFSSLAMHWNVSFHNSGRRQKRCR